MPESDDGNPGATRQDPRPGAGKQEPARTRPGKEIGGQTGPEPTRYGDWERNGRCTDF
jgi:hypothetical protein